MLTRSRQERSCPLMFGGRESMARGVSLDGKSYDDGNASFV